METGAEYKVSLDLNMPMHAYVIISQGYITFVEMRKVVKSYLNQ